MGTRLDILNIDHFSVFHPSQLTTDLIYGWVRGGGEDSGLLVDGGVDGRGLIGHLLHGDLGEEEVDGDEPHDDGEAETDDPQDEGGSKVSAIGVGAVDTTEHQPGDEGHHGQEPGEEAENNGEDGNNLLDRPDPGEDEGQADPEEEEDGGQDGHDTCGLEPAITGVHGTSNGGSPVHGNADASSPATIVGISTGLPESHVAVTSSRVVPHGEDDGGDPEHSDSGAKACQGKVKLGAGRVANGKHEIGRAHV